MRVSLIEQDDDNIDSGDMSQEAVVRLLPEKFEYWGY